MGGADCSVSITGCLYRCFVVNLNVTLTYHCQNDSCKIESSREFPLRASLVRFIFDDNNLHHPVVLHRNVVLSHHVPAHLFMGGKKKKNYKQLISILVHNALLMNNHFEFELFRKYIKRSSLLLFKTSYNYCLSIQMKESSAVIIFRRIHHK